MPANGKLADNAWKWLAPTGNTGTSMGATWRVDSDMVTVTESGLDRLPPGLDRYRWSWLGPIRAGSMAIEAR